MRLPSEMSAAVKRLNPGIFLKYPDLKPYQLHPVDPTVKESLTVQPTKQEMRDEREFQERVCALLRNRGIVYGRSRMDKKTGNTVGLPDFLFAFKGYPIAWELKMPGKVSTKEQEQCQIDMRKNGWHVKVLFTIYEVLTELRDMGAVELS